MSRPIAAIIGLLAFPLFCFFCIRADVPMIQSDILARTTSAMAVAGAPAGGLSVSGRDVLLSGAAGSPIVSDRMRDIAGGIKGVRVVDVNITGSSAAKTGDVLPDASTVAAKADSQRSLDRVLQTSIVKFNTGSSTLTAAGQATLNQIVPILAATPALQCAIHGYTDSTGNKQQNIELSRRRAIASQEYLIAKGISGNRLTADGYGDASPIASNETLEGRHKNRRIEFLLKEKN